MSAPAEFVGTRFEPWGEYRACNTSVDCYEAPFGSPTYVAVATCTKFAEGIPGANVTDHSVCTCSIMFGRSGYGCDTRDPITMDIEGAVFLVVFLFELHHFVNFSRVFVAGVRQKVLKNNAVAWTILSCAVTMFTLMIYTSSQSLLCLGVNPAGPVNIIGAGLAGMNISITVSVCTLSWHEVLNSANIRRKRRGVNPCHKFLVFAGSTVVGLLCIYFLLNSNTPLASQIVLMYLVLLFFVYLYVGCHLRKFLHLSSASQGSSDGPDKSVAVQRVADRISRCIKQVLLFICMFVVGILAFSLFTTTTKASALQQPVIARIGLFIVHTSPGLCARWIFQCSARPIMAKLHFQGRFMGSSVAPTSIQNESIKSTANGSEHADQSG